MPGLHSKKSPSGAKRLHACPGALALVDTLPEEMRARGGAAADLGTATHFLLETSLLAGQPPESYIGRLIVIPPENSDEDAVMLKASAKMPKKPDVRNRTYEVDDEMAANADLAYAYAVKRCAELHVPLSKLALETRTNPVPDRDDTDGTADITLDAWPLVLEVIDYKNGRVTVEHDDNPQLLAYLAGKAWDTGWCHDDYQITVVQPNGRHDEGKVRSFPITKDALRAFVDKHRTAATLADAAAAELTDNGGDIDAVHVDPGNGQVFIGENGAEVTWAEAWLNAGDHCDDSFCEGRLTCPAYKLWKQAQAGRDFDDDPPSKDDMKAAKLNMATETAVAIMRHAASLQAMIKLASGFLYAEAKAGRLPPGMKWVRKRGTNKLNMESVDVPEGASPEYTNQLMADAIVEAGYIGDNERAELFNPATLKTGPQIRDMVPSKLRQGFADAFLVKPPGGLKLVHEDDPGTPVVVNVADDFTDEEDDHDSDD